MTDQSMPPEVPAPPQDVVPEGPVDPGPVPDPVQPWAELALAVVAVGEIVLEGYSWEMAHRQFQERARRKYQKQWMAMLLRGQPVWRSMMPAHDADGHRIEGKFVGRSRSANHRPDRRDLRPGYLPGTGTPRCLPKFRNRSV